LINVALIHQVQPCPYQDECIDQQPLPVVVSTHCAPAIEQLWRVAAADVGVGRDLDRDERIELRQRRLDLFAVLVFEVGGLAFGAYPAVLRIVHPLAAPPPGVAYCGLTYAEPSNGASVGH
jgi:hypothetical protein